MISFRYHLVSIVAVFLALALGVVVGTTVVNQGIIQDLRSRTEAATRNASNYRQQLDEVKKEVTTGQIFEKAVLPLLVKDQLTGTQVALVTQQDVDPSEVEGVRGVLDDSGASVVGEVVITNRMSLADDRARSDMASALGAADGQAADQLAGEAADALAGRLASGPEIGAPDLLDTLRSKGFVVIRGGAQGVAGVGGPGQVVVLLAGSTDPDPALAPQLFLAPLATALVQAQRPVAAAETEDSAAPFVLLLRHDGQLDGQMVTVDNADQAPGRAALILGLRDLLTSPGNGGDYGVKAGASSLLPKP